MSGTRRIPDPVARRRAAALAGHQADEPAARAALADPEPVVRGAALGALVRLARAAPEDIARVLGDADPTVRRRAAEEAARSGLDVGAVLVARLDTETDDGVVEALAFALGEVAPVADGAVEALSVAASHDDVLVREAAVAALGGVGDVAGLPAVLRATTDVATVRRRAVLALAAFSGGDVEAALARLASDRDRQVRQAAEDLLQGWGL